MTPTQILETLGRTLYGTAWITPLGRRGHVSPKTIRRWLTGKETVPDSFWRDLLDWVEDAIDELTKAREAIAKLTKHETPET